MWGIWVAVASILLDHLFDKSIKASSINEFLLTYRSTFSGTSLLFVAALVLFMIANMVLNKVTNYLRIRQRPSLQFQKIMNWNTCSELKSVSFSGYSWGYNRTLCIPRDVSGWLPEAFFIRDYDKGKYVFPSEDEGLKGYNSGEYKKFISTDPLVKTITGKDEERIRYAVTHIEQNTNKRSPKVEVDLKETDWLSLQFSWKYLRRLDTDNVPIQGEDQVKSAEVGKAFSDVFQAN